MKTEPSTYSFSQLEKDGKTNWNGIRNFQARNFLKEAHSGDLALIYHSGDEKAVVGIAEITSLPYPDLDPKKPGDWVQVDLKPKKRLASPIPLSAIKKEKNLNSLLLVRQSRLSTMKITALEYEAILSLAQKSAK